MAELEARLVESLTRLRDDLNAVLEQKPEPAPALEPSTAAMRAVRGYDYCGGRETEDYLARIIDRYCMTPRVLEVLKHLSLVLAPYSGPAYFQDSYATINDLIHDLENGPTRHE